MRGIQNGLLIIAVWMLALPFIGCGPSPEEKYAIDAVNKKQELIEKNAHVKRVTLEKKRDDNVSAFSGDVLDEKGKPIGKVEGHRIEGFGTMIDRLNWNDQPQLSEEDKKLERKKQWLKRANENRLNLLRTSDLDKDGRVTFEEASQRNMMLQKPGFDRLDTNKDGGISMEDNLDESKAASMPDPPNRGGRRNRP